MKILACLSASILTLALFGGVAVAAPDDGCPWPVAIPASIAGTADEGNGLHRTQGDITLVRCSVSDGGLFGNHTGVIMQEVSPDVYVLKVYTGNGPITTDSASLELTKFQLHQCINDVRKLCQNAGLAFPTIN